MGFFEKVKNMFTEEVEDDDVKVEQIKRDTTKVTFEAPKEEEKEEKTDNLFEQTEKIEPIEDIDDIYEDEEDAKPNKPIFFDDKDFRDLGFGTKEEKVEPKKEVEQPIYTRSSIYTKETITNDTREPYGRKIERETVVVEEKKIFKPTPIISPVYGILDKNYHKEDIVSRNEVKTPELNPIDTVRNKAYGTLEDELENTLFGTNSILFKKDEKDSKSEVSEIDDSVLSNLTDDISKELDELLIKKEKYDSVDDVEEKPKHDKKDISDTSDEEDDLLNFIDSTLYKDGEE